MCVCVAFRIPWPRVATLRAKGFRARRIDYRFFSRLPKSVPNVAKFSNLSCWVSVSLLCKTHLTYFDYVQQLFLLFCVCVWFVFIPKNCTKSLSPSCFSLPKTAVFPDHHKEPILLKVEILFLLLVKRLKTNSKIKPGSAPEPPNRVRSEFRRGQTPKQLDSAATAVMTLVAVAATAAEKPQLLPLESHRNSSRTGRTTSSPDCPPEEGGSGGGNSAD